MKSGIYAILNLINDKYYVGSAVNLYNRWIQHKNKLNKNIHVNKHFQASWNKYGQINFLFVVLEYVEISKIIDHEQIWLDELKANNIEFGYNKRLVARSNLGLKRNSESKLRSSFAQKGKILSEAHAQKLKGRKFSDEARKNMSIASTGRKLSDVSRAKVSTALIGHKVSQETRDKIASTLKNRRLPLILKRTDVIELNI